MEIWHRVTFDGSVQDALDSIPVQYKISPLPHRKIGLLHVDIAESDPRWQQVLYLIRLKNGLDIYNTVFTEQEILKAPWSRLIPIFEQGYPQPENSWSVQPVTYEEHCPECGVYQRQRESFRIKKEPRLGKNQFMSLHWGYALFTNSTVLTEFAKHRLQGYEEWEVLLHKTGQPSKILSQIHIPHIAQTEFIPEETLKRKMCSRCGTTKYFPHMRGYMRFHSNLLETEFDFLLSREWFGDGHSAFREILISNNVARLILEKKWRGVRLKPIRIITEQKGN